MSQLEQELRELGATFFPAEPDIRAAVRAELRRPPRRRRVTPLLAFAALVLAVLAAALAIPQARSALERWFGIGAARIEHVDTLPRLRPAVALHGVPATRAEARRAFGRPLLLPASLGRPDEIRIASDLGVVFAWDEPAPTRLLEVVVGGSILKKLVYGETTVERVDVLGRIGVWIEGRHGVQYNFGQPEIAGNALIWERDGVTFRLDGRITRARALEIARSVQT